MTRALVLMALCALVAGCASAERGGGGAVTAQRELPAEVVEGLVGGGVCYGPYRDGQRPGGPGPSDEQLLEDLRIMSRHWGFLRTYSSRESTPRLLAVIREHGIPMRVMVGAWIGPEAGDPEVAAANAAEVASAIRLANAYPEIVFAVSVGNETQVWWSGHRTSAGVLIGAIREARAGTRVPVTTADDFSYWLSPEAAAVAAEVDFIVNHAYAMWNGRLLEDAVAFTDEKMDEVSAAFPGHEVVLGEAGWATRVHTEGEQARLIKGEAGETEQARFVESFMAWAESERVPTFYFSAFDENWKGGDHPDEVEKHWGVYNEDRTPKPAAAVLPERGDG